MALISLMSAKGAPGTTTTAMLLANLWPAPSVLVDADPWGGDVALRLMGETGRALDPDRGLMSLLPPARRGLSPEMVAQHAQVAYGGQPVVVGLPGPEQAMAAAPLWPALAKAFGAVPDRDVIADLGQVHGRSAHLAMVEQSDILLCVFRPSARSVIHTSRRLLGLAELVRSTQLQVGIVGIGSSRDTTDLRNGAGSIINRLDWVEDFGVISLDPKAVAMYEGGTTPRPERTMLVRSAHEVVERLHGALGPAATPVSTSGSPSGPQTPAPGAQADPQAGTDHAVDEAPTVGAVANPAHAAEPGATIPERNDEFRGMGRGGRRRAERKVGRS